MTGDRPGLCERIGAIVHSIVIAIVAWLHAGAVPEGRVVWCVANDTDGLFDDFRLFSYRSLFCGGLSLFDRRLNVAQEFVINSVLCRCEQP